MGAFEDGRDGVVWHGNEDLRPLLVPLDQLHEDPANTNTHPEESIRGIAASYARFGQNKPVVSDKAGVVRDGNGQLAAARRLGWTHLAVSRSDLVGVDLTAYAIASNRIAELSVRDEQRLAEQLEAIRSEPDFPLEATGYSDDQVADLLAKLGDEAAGDETASVIDTEEAGGATAASYLKFGDASVPLTEEELAGLAAALDRHVTATGTPYGFAAGLLAHVRP